MIMIRHLIIYAAIVWLWQMPQTACGQTGSPTTAGEMPLSPTEGSITSDFVEEDAMMADLLQMLAHFSRYMVDDFEPCKAPNSLGERCGCFRGERTMASNEAGVRTNADLSMLCAFLTAYAQPAVIALPEGITWQQISDIAMQSLVFAYSTHKANRLKTCAGGDYWGSTSLSDHVWESSLWAMSVAYSAFFQWERLSEAQRGYIHALLLAECNYELERDIPTGYQGDTKAEENGWEADVLAAALGLFPDDPLAPQWMERLRLFAINSYSHPADAHNLSPIDPDRAGTIADLYRGPNLYEDYTLQNHHLFHTSYQNVVIQELGEAALALHLFQGKSRQPRWSTRALTHNCQQVTDEVLNWLALTDGELAMPNGNDWSLFLYDQITSYSTMATLLRDPHALMLENLAYKYIKARQSTTADGSWLLRPDVQARRMGVEGHRVMMTYLMHHAWSTADLRPTSWEDFRQAHSEARLLKCQNNVRAFTRDRFTTFSWSEGLRSYTGYIAANSVDKNKIIVPYRAHNTGNILGWYEVDGKPTDARPVVPGTYHLDGDAYTMYGELLTNGRALDHRFALFSTAGNAVGYLDHVSTRDDVCIRSERGGLMAISTDELTRTRRTLTHRGGQQTTDGQQTTTYATEWMNIDGEVGIVSLATKGMAFGDRASNNNIMTAKIYPSYSSTPRNLTKGTVADRRNVIYYSMVDAATTERMAHESQRLTDQLPEGWNGLIACDPDQTRYLMAAHFDGDNGEAVITAGTTDLGAPVFEGETLIGKEGSTTRLSLEKGTAAMQTITYFIKGEDITARLTTGSPATLTLTAKKKSKITLSHISRGKIHHKKMTLRPGKPSLFHPSH